MDVGALFVVVAVGVVVVVDVGALFLVVAVGVVVVAGVMPAIKHESNQTKLPIISSPDLKIEPLILIENIRLLEVATVSIFLKFFAVFRRVG